MEQHRISKVYWKHFAFDKLNERTNKIEGHVCYLNLGNNDPVLKTIPIKEFTTETNLFDTSITDPVHFRYFEELNGKLETHYNNIINALAKNGGLSGKRVDHLAGFAANLFVRQEAIREDFLIPVLRDDGTRRKLFNEITMLKNDANRKLTLAVFEEIEKDNPQINDYLNAISGEIWYHLYQIFRKFTHVFLKAPKDKYWFSTDNPVYVDNRDSIEAWMIAPQAEIYFPLSKDYLLFMYNHRIQTDNRLRTFPTNKVVEATDELIEHIIHTSIEKSIKRYFVMPKNHEGIDVRTVS